MNWTRWTEEMNDYLKANYGMIMKIQKTYVTNEGVSIARGKFYKSEGNTELKEGIETTMFYDAVELTEQEIKEAIHEGKKRKFFKLKNASYWLEQESKIVKKKHVTNL